MELWEQFLSKLQEEWGTATVSQWLRPLKLVRFDAANIYLEARDAFQIHWLQEHLKKRLQKEPLTNNNGRKVNLHFSLPQPSSPSIPKTSRSPAHHLDPELTFSNFVASSANQMLLDLLQKVESAPFNPIYLYGPSKIGKSHLLVATAHLLQQKGKKVLYQKAGLFTEQVIQAMRTGEMRSLRASFRAVDALLIDDVHDFARKFATQEEFFHTFNELHTRGCPILLSSRLLPSKLEEIEQRLISRFEWGIALEIATTPSAHILEKKASLWKLSLTPDLIPYLVHTFPNSSLTALTALALRAKTSSPIDPLLAAGLLKDLLAKEQEESWNEEKIVKKVAERFGIPPADLLGKSQTRDTVLPRQVAITLCRTLLKRPLQQIGKFFGKDHSTILSSIAKVEQHLKQDPALAEWLAGFSLPKKN